MGNTASQILPKAATGKRNDEQRRAGFDSPSKKGIFMLAKDIMTKDVISVGPATSVKELAKILIRNQISGAPVIDRTGKILGIVSDADIVRKKARQVKSIMSPAVVSIDEETPVEKIARLMTVYKLKRLPVVRGQRVVGIVSRADIVGAIAMGKHIALHTPIYDL
jgi:predicted transcriptional regulator